MRAVQGSPLRIGGVTHSSFAHKPSLLTLNTYLQTIQQSHLTSHLFLSVCATVEPSIFQNWLILIVPVITFLVTRTSMSLVMVIKQPSNERSFKPPWVFITPLG